MEMHDDEPSPVDVSQRRSSYSSAQADAPGPRSPVATASLQSPCLTMAAPLSSSPGSPTKRVLSPELLRKHVGNANTASEEDRKLNALPKLSTATLQERFLPRRRLRSRQWRDDHDEEHDSSEDGSSGEDELTSRRARKTRGRGLYEARSGNARVKSKRVNNNARKEGGGDTQNGTNTLKSTATVVSEKPDFSQPRNRVTYSRRDAEMADKENYLSDDSSSLSSPPPSEELDSDSYSPAWKPGNRTFSEELEQQARKFAEIDKWQMDFEEVSVSGSPSSPFR